MATDDACITERFGIQRCGTTATGYRPCIIDTGIFGVDGYIILVGNQLACVGQVAIDIEL